MKDVVIRVPDAEAANDVMVYVGKTFTFARAIGCYDVDEHHNENKNNKHDKKMSDKSQHLHTRTRWTQDDITQLLSMRSQDATIQQMMNALGRTYSSIGSKLWEIDKKEA